MPIAFTICICLYVMLEKTFSQCVIQTTWEASTYMYSRYFWFTLDDKEISFTFYLFQYLGEDKGGRENREKVWIVINLNSFPVKHRWDSWGRVVKKQSKLKWNKSHFEFLDVCSSNVGCLRKNPPVQSSCTSFCWLTRNFCVWTPIL